MKVLVSLHGESEEQIVDKCKTLNGKKLIFVPSSMPTDAFVQLCSNLNGQDATIMYTGSWAFTDYVTDQFSYIFIMDPDGFLTATLKKYIADGKDPDIFITIPSNQIQF